MSFIHLYFAILQRLLRVSIGYVLCEAAYKIGIFSAVIGWELFGASLHAKEEIYADSLIPPLAIDVSSLGKHPVTLIMILQAIERQSGFCFVYVASDLPIKTTLLLETSSSTSLDKLLRNMTLMLDITFQRFGKIIVVRPRWISNKGSTSVMDFIILQSTATTSTELQSHASTILLPYRRFDS